MTGSSTKAAGSSVEGTGPATDSFEGSAASSCSTVSMPLSLTTDASLAPTATSKDSSEAASAFDSGTVAVAVASWTGLATASSSSCSTVLDSLSMALSPSTEAPSTAAASPTDLPEYTSALDCGTADAASLVGSPAASTSCFPSFSGSLDSLSIILLLTTNASLSFNSSDALTCVTISFSSPSLWTTAEWMSPLPPIPSKMMPTCTPSALPAPLKLLCAFKS
mmetsp:Transcript_8722/g.21211  ORF Transcript_8722/g.21211 Transcript_8722/m.21211 type:complete len:222 (-) Transcript_8722:260-925(-)